MDDALLVRRLERFGDLPRDRQCLIDRNRALRDPVGERRPLDQPMTSARTPSASSTPKIASTFGWFSEASARASRRSATDVPHYSRRSRGRL